MAVRKKIVRPGINNKQQPFTTEPQGHTAKLGRRRLSEMPSCFSGEDRRLVLSQDGEASSKVDVQVLIHVKQMDLRQLGRGRTKWTTSLGLLLAG
ncbi:hypothetical protein DVH24_037371 [Malus domestica]|uniref:Uncharacterized protein n=1 Tax=Malus domestica TaxID=3750 RepID=A0A498HJL8_MALDO|nr:hypothetical protein DVH24_037371 [Malus domestica]